MIVPDRNFRPNPTRAVFVQGTIDQQLVDRLLPRILLLQDQSRDPITVYIDSRGGHPASGELLLNLLTSSNQDSASPCRTITVVTSRAASTAADLLSSGDYAIAFADSSVLYHGVRTLFGDPLTVEAASFVAESLKVSNDQFAIKLARRSNKRFFFRYIAMRGDFDAYRTKTAKPQLSQLGCFIGMLRERISQAAIQVVGQAEARNRRYESLSAKLWNSRTLNKQIDRLDQPGYRLARVQATMLKIMIDFELANNTDPAWTFVREGTGQLRDDFMLFHEYLGHNQSGHLDDLCRTWGAFVLTDQDNQQILTLPEPEREEARLAKLRPEFLPLWLFFVALCHALQEGENDLTALDAFWLGLIDEVVGQPDLPILRLVSEFKPDPAQQPAPALPPTSS